MLVCRTAGNGNWMEWEWVRDERGGEEKEEKEEDREGRGMREAVSHFF